MSDVRMTPLGKQESSIEVKIMHKLPQHRSSYLPHESMVLIVIYRFESIYHLNYTYYFHCILSWRSLEMSNCVKVVHLQIDNIV